MPTTCLPGPAWSAPAQDPMVSMSAHVAPPCSRPNGCSFPATGMVATIRSGSKSVIAMPSFSSSGLSLSAGAQAGGGVATPATVTSRGPAAGTRPERARVGGQWGPFIRIGPDVSSRLHPRDHRRPDRPGHASPAAAPRRALAGLPRLLRAAGGELLDDDGPADQRRLRLHVDADQRPARREAHPPGG